MGWGWVGGRGVAVVAGGARTAGAEERERLAGQAVLGPAEEINVQKWFVCSHLMSFVRT